MKEINRDVIERYSSRIRELNAQIDRAQNIVITLEWDRNSVDEALLKVRDYLSSAEDAVNTLTDKKKYARRVCNRYVDVINRAARCMEKYESVRVVPVDGDSVTHIREKELW